MVDWQIDANRPRRVPRSSLAWVLRWTLRQVSAMRCVPAAQRETAILNLADENGSDEEVQSDRRDSRGLPETCERRHWRIRDPTWRKRDPTWRKKATKLAKT